MPRRMPRFDRQLAHQAQLAIGLVRAGEASRINGGHAGRTDWTIARLEALHEFAYLRVFAAWETCLEAIFFRSLCGYASGAGQETLLTGPHFPSLAAAETAALAAEGPGFQFLLWHSPWKVITRCRRFIQSGLPHCHAVQETVMASSSTRLSHLSHIRHRIVHDQEDAKRKFDTATQQFSGRTYPASRPGRFLRDWTTSVPRQRWLDVAVNELVSLAAQMV